MKTREPTGTAARLSARVLERLDRLVPMPLDARDAAGCRSTGRSAGLVPQRRSFQGPGLAAATRARAGPPGGVYLSAFRTRLRRMAPSSAGSLITEIPAGTTRSLPPFCGAAHAAHAARAGRRRLLLRRFIEAGDPGKSR
jgi:hypothetical protein